MPRETFDRVSPYSTDRTLETADGGALTMTTAETKQAPSPCPRWRRWLRWALRLAAGAVTLALVTFGIAYWRSGNMCDDTNVPAPRDPMKAVIYCDYGSPDVLRFEEVEKPVPLDNQILVRVRAVSVNPLDWHYMRGEPYIMRLGTGLRRPAETRLGVDFAGTVEAVGPSVTRFKPGNEVFGGLHGAFAEYLVVREDGAVVPKPANLTFEQAASIPIAAITALQGLRDRGRLQPGQKVLINGASGGVGTYAVQIAKWLGAHVTGVCSTRNVEMVRSLGADEVIDYTKDDFTRGAQRYDVILDNVGNRGLLECRRVLAPRGSYVMVGGGKSGEQGLFGPLWGPVKTLLLSPFVSQEMGMFMADLKQEDLASLGDLMQAGKVKPIIDRRYTFGEIREAIRYLEEGHARGKVVVALD